MRVPPSGSVGRDPTDGADLDGAAPARGVTATAGSRMARSARHSATGTTTGGRLELATPHKCGRPHPRSPLLISDPSNPKCAIAVRSIGYREINIEPGRRRVEAGLNRPFVGFVVSLRRAFRMSVFRAEALQGFTQRRRRCMRSPILMPSARLVARLQVRLTTKHDQAGSSSLISGLSCRTEFSSDW